MTEIREFLRQSERVSFRWGRNDCLLFVADALVAQGAPDPAGPWRGAYRSRKGAEGIIHRHGGLVGLFEDANDAAGILPADQQVVGAVAVVQPVNQSQDPFGALWTGRFWAALAPSGLALIAPDKLEVISTWRLH